MTKKGQKGTYHKPKPRVAVYLGLAGSGLRAAGADPSVPMPGGNTITAAGARFKSASLNATRVATDAGTALQVALPAAGGVIASIAADKVGVNRLLAKAKAPFRV